MSSTHEKAARGARRARPPRERADRRITALLGEIDDLERARGELCSLVSHDLRNPLSVLLLNMQVLSRMVPADAPARRVVDAVGRAYEEMNQLADDLSDVARILDDRLTLQPSDEDPAALVEASVASVRAASTSKQLTIDVAAAPALPRIRCDRARVARVLSVLLSGAIRLTPKGGTIHLRAEPEGEGGVRFAVTDGGSGLSEEARAMMFQLPTPPPRGEGRRVRSQLPAIALFVARGFVEAHGGEIGVTAEPERGTTISFTIPAWMGEEGEGA
jgi:signal transduction histidine kinase